MKINVFKRHRMWRQFLYATLVSYGSFCTGLSMGWTSPVLPKLRDLERSPLSDVIEPLEESWVGSLLVFGGIFGPLITVPSSNRIGRRYTIMISCLPLLLGWLLAGIATNLPTLYVARLAWGVAVGMQFAIVPVYIGEISEDAVRGALSSFFLLFINIGFFGAYVIGPYTSYWTTAAIGGVLSLIYIPFVYFIPETPFFLVFKGRILEASETLQLLRGKSSMEVQGELSSLQTLIEREFATEPRIKDLWATRGNAKALGMCIFLAMLLQLSGIDVLLFYMEVLLLKIGTDLPAAEATIILGFVQVLAACVTPLVIDRLGRRLLMWTTSLGLTFCLFIIGLYAILDAYKYPFTNSVVFIPLVCLVIYMILFNLGVGPVPWVLVAEMFPIKTKILAAGICSCMCWIAGFVWTRFFGDVERMWGIYTAFWILSICCAIGFVFSITLLPETKGKTFEEIQRMLNKGNSYEVSQDNSER